MRKIKQQVVIVLVMGTVISGTILAATKGGYDQTLAVDLYGIQVTDNFLSLEFIFPPSATSKANGTARLANAIEIKVEEQ